MNARRGDLDRAATALKADGSIISFGSTTYGSDNSSVSQGNLSSVKDITCNPFTCVALKSNGTVVAWGPSPPGDISSVAGDLNNVLKIYGNRGGAFAALKGDGSVVTWGVPQAGGTNPGTIRSLIIFCGVSKRFAFTPNNCATLLGFQPIFIMFVFI